MKPTALLIPLLVSVFALTSGCTTKTKVAPDNAATTPVSNPTPAPKLTPAPEPALNPVDVAVVDIPPRAYRQTSATYPSELRKSGISGKVLLSFILDTDGKPTQIKSIEADNDLFLKSAINAFSRWRFYPAQKDGLPVACKMQQIFVFNAASQ